MKETRGRDEGEKTDLRKMETNSELKKTRIGIPGLY
jgi:hypothetical protein